jgi:phospholipase C
VVILYDDSDGWYDHQMSPILNQSATAADALTGPGLCGSGVNALPGVASGTTHAQGRCGYGPRQPFLVISPFSRHNFVDHTVTNQASVIRFIEDNWLDSQRIGAGSFDEISNSFVQMLNFNRHGDGDQDADDGVLILNPTTGQPTHSNN